jgi:hypothetical protein
MRLRRVLLAAGLGAVGILLPLAAAPAQAIPYELDQGTLQSSGPPASAVCAQTTGTRVCYEEGGDYWWVRDTKADKSFSTAEWTATDYSRYGECQNRLGYGTWARCNKDYKEGLKMRVQGVTIGKTTYYSDPIYVYA